MNAAIFDLDGTILDSMPVWLHAGEILLKKLNKTPEPDLGNILLEKSMIEGAEYLIENYDLKFSPEELIVQINQVVKEAYASTIQCKPGAREFLLHLKATGTKISLCTNTDRDTFLPALHRLALSDIFDDITTVSEFKSSKNHPEIFLHVLKKLNAKPEETWLFEDAYYSIRTAANLGINVAAIYDESSKSHKELIEKKCTKYFNDYKEIQKYFEE